MLHNTGKQKFYIVCHWTLGSGTTLLCIMNLITLTVELRFIYRQKQLLNDYPNSIMLEALNIRTNPKLVLFLE